jgi:LAO/AO transport system kinase
MGSLAEAILRGDTRALARAATAVENRRPEALALLQELFPRTGRATLIGVTGPPGAGKSTLVDQLARSLRAEGRTVGIVAVDPTSPFSGGAILGDRVRMQAHHADPGVFIRSMATRGALGGLAAATTDIALLLDAAGREVILIETVGVGQDEVEVARLADVTLLVLVPGMGDDVQSMKAGIMEIADVLVINKSDRAGADTLERELRAALSLGGRQPPILRTVATEGKGIGEVLAAVRSFQESGPAANRRVELWAGRLREMLRERLLERLPAGEIEAAAQDVAARRRDPYSIVQEWLDALVRGRLQPTGGSAGGPGGPPHEE